MASPLKRSIEAILPPAQERHKQQRHEKQNICHFTNANDVAIESIDKGIIPEETPPLLLASNGFHIHRSFCQRIVDGRVDWSRDDDGNDAFFYGFAKLHVSSESALEAALVLQANVVTLLVKTQAFEALTEDLRMWFENDTFPFVDRQRADLMRISAREAHNAVFNKTTEISMKDDEAFICVEGPIPFARLVDETMVSRGFDCEWFASQLEGVDLSKATDVGSFVGDCRDTPITFRTIFQRSPLRSKENEHLTSMPYADLETIRPLIVASKDAQETAPQPPPPLKPKRDVVKELAPEGCHVTTFFEYLVETSPRSSEFEFADSAKLLLLKQNWELELCESFFSLEYSNVKLYVIDVYAENRIEFEAVAISRSEARRLVNTFSNILVYYAPTKRWARCARVGNCLATPVRLSDSAIGLLMERARDAVTTTPSVHITATNNTNESEGPLMRLRTAIESSCDSNDEDDDRESLSAGPEATSVIGDL
jgi:hypothetical protein